MGIKWISRRKEEVEGWKYKSNGAPAIFHILRQD
jgi:hypothetical protein